MDSDDIGRQKVDGLPEHPGFRFDPPDAPTDDPEAVDHRRMRICADERVGVVDAILLEDAGREILEVHLVNDADSGRNDVETVKRLHAPLEEFVARAVPLEL